MKIHTITIEQTFPAPVEQIWEAFNDHASFGRMIGQNLQRIKDSTDPDNINGIGSVRLIKLPFAPFEETIRASKKPDFIEYQISKGTPLHHHYGRMRFSSLPNNQSAIHYTIEMGSKYPMVASLLSTILKSAIGKGLEKYAKSLASK